MKSHIIALAIMAIVCIDISRAGARIRFNKAALKMKGRHVEEVDHWSGSGNNGGPGGLSLPYSRGMTFGDYDDGRKYGRKTNRRRVAPGESLWCAFTKGTSCTQTSYRLYENPVKILTSYSALKRRYESLPTKVSNSKTPCKLYYRM